MLWVKCIDVQSLAQVLRCEDEGLPNYLRIRYVLCLWQVKQEAKSSSDVLLRQLLLLQTERRLQNVNGLELGMESIGLHIRNSWLSLG